MRAVGPLTACVVPREGVFTCAEDPVAIECASPYDHYYVSGWGGVYIDLCVVPCLVLLLLHTLLCLLTSRRTCTYIELTNGLINGLSIC